VKVATKEEVELLSPSIGVRCFFSFYFLDRWWTSKEPKSISLLLFL